jgi:hypothetical protein
MSREHEVRLPDRFWRHCTKLSAEAKAVYSILLTFIDYNTGETHVGNPRLERESGYGQKKVKALLLELENAGFVERKRLFVGNLKSKRILRCLKFLSKGLFSPNRFEGAVFDRSKNAPISLPSHGHPSPTQEQEKSSLPLPDQKSSERIM